MCNLFQNYVMYIHVFILFTSPLVFKFLSSTKSHICKILKMYSLLSIQLNVFSQSKAYKSPVSTPINIKSS
uniref:Uncharacterized protein n=2 Tax=Anguilla anguilla TaxID=7936 RepID=A0A0E9VVH9_ANGAN